MALACPPLAVLSLYLPLRGLINPLLPPFELLNLRYRDNWRGRFAESDRGSKDERIDEEMADPGVSADDAMIAALKVLGEEPDAADPQAARIGILSREGCVAPRNYLRVSFAD